MMDIIEQESVLYVTAALCTFLAILVSYRWLVGKPTSRVKEDKENVTKETEKASEEEMKVPAGCPFGFGSAPTTDENEDDADENLENINNLLINSSDIKPLDEDEKKRLEEEAAVEDQEKLDRRRIKELEEEVEKSMSEQQLEDERTVRQAQLEAIFSLMKENNDRFGVESVDEVQSQYKLYV